jgi:hypothetical protein
VKAYAELKSGFVILARKTDQLWGESQAADWRSSSLTDADFAGQSAISPRGWDGNTVLRACAMTSREQTGTARIRSDSFDGLAGRYRVFVANIGSEKWSSAEVVAFDSKRDGREFDQRVQQRHWIDGLSAVAMDDAGGSLSAQHDRL